MSLGNGFADHNIRSSSGKNSSIKSMPGSMVTIVMGNGKKHNEAVLIVGHELPDDRVDAF
jgi:hypothetical protein